MESKKNILWINYLKAISIIGVFFVHCQLYYHFWLGSINNFIHPFYVNAFFFVSGYLLFRKQLSEPLIDQTAGEYLVGGGKSLCSNILWRLVLPTILFSVIEFFPSHVLRGHGFDISTFLCKTIGGCTYWFTAALVVAELLIVGMLLTRTRNVWFYFATCCVFFMLGQIMVANEWTIFKQDPSLPWQYQNGLYALLFLAFGGLYWRYEDAINKWMNRYTLLGMIVVYVVCLVFQPAYFRVLVSTLDLNAPGILISLLSTMILIELCKKLPTISLLNYIGQNTICFYFMSGALPIIVGMVVSKAIGLSVFGYIMVFIVSLTFALIGTYIINRWFPWLLDMRVVFKKSK